MSSLGVLCVATIFLVCYACYSNSLEGEWTYDDNFAVVNNEDVQPATPWTNLLLHDYWGQDITKPDSHKSYRPLTILSFRLNCYLHGMETYGYHLGSVLLHCLTSVLVYALSQELFLDRWISLISGMLFGLHPIHTESVSSIVGRAETLCAVFYLVAILTFQKATTLPPPTNYKKAIWQSVLRICFVLCYAMATLSKETGYTVLGVMLFQDLLLAPSKLNLSSYKTSPNPKTTHQSRPMRNRKLFGILDWKNFVILFCCGISYIILRTWLTTTFTLHNYRHLENPIAFAPVMLTRALSSAYLHTKYLLLLVFPLHLSADYSFNALPLVESLSDYRNLHTLAAYAVLILSLVSSAIGSYIGQRAAPKILWLLLFGVFSFLPASNIFFYVGTMLAERLLYIPSIPFCILVAWIIMWAVRKSSALRGKHPILGIALLLMTTGSIIGINGWYAWRTYSRNFDWRNEHDLFISAMQTCPGSAKVWQNVGILHRRSQNWDKALDAFGKARTIEPAYCELDYWVGLTLLNRGDTEPALDYLRRSVGCIYTQVQSVTTLHKIYSVLMSQNPSNATYYSEWGTVLELINRTEEAASHFHKAAIIHHNAASYQRSIPLLQRSLSLLRLLPHSASSIELTCSTYMWLGAGYLDTDDLTRAVDNIRAISGIKTFLSPPNEAPLACTSLREQARGSLLGLYVKQIQSGTVLDARARFELGILLAEQGHIEKALNQYYESAILLSNKGDWLPALQVLTYAVENTQEKGKSLQAFQNMVELRNQFAKTIENLQTSYHENRFVGKL